MLNKHNKAKEVYHSSEQKIIMTSTNIWGSTQVDHPIPSGLPKVTHIWIKPKSTQIGITPNWPKLISQQVVLNWDHPKLVTPTQGGYPSCPKLESPQVDPNWDHPKLTPIAQCDVTWTWVIFFIFGDISPFNISFTRFLPIQNEKWVHHWIRKKNSSYFFFKFWKSDQEVRSYGQKCENCISPTKITIA